MTAPGSDAVLLLFFLALMIAGSYAMGRLHQWYRQTTERDDAFREGYDRASYSLFALVTRHEGRKPRPAPPGETRVAMDRTTVDRVVTAGRAAAPLPRGRHAVEVTATRDLSARAH
jgi:hypothetical protein